MRLDCRSFLFWNHLFGVQNLIQSSSNVSIRWSHKDMTVPYCCTHAVKRFLSHSLGVAKLLFFLTCLVKRICSIPFVFQNIQSIVASAISQRRHFSNFYSGYRFSLSFTMSHNRMLYSSPVTAPETDPSHVPPPTPPSEQGTSSHFFPVHEPPHHRVPDPRKSTATKASPLPHHCLVAENTPPG